MMLADFDGRKLWVQQDKTDARILIPVHELLLPYVQESVALAKGEGRINAPLIRNEEGSGLNRWAFGSRWDAVAVRVGVGDLQRRDLRRTAVIRMIEAGCTIPEVGSVTGHSPKSIHEIITTYWTWTPEVAEAAITKLEDHMRAKEARIGTDS